MNAKRSILFAVTVSLMFLSGLGTRGAENTPPTVWECCVQPLVTIGTGMTLSPAPTATNSGYAAITCVGNPITASGAGAVVLREGVGCEFYVILGGLLIPTGQTNVVSVVSNDFSWSAKIGADLLAGDVGANATFTSTNGTAGTFTFYLGDPYLSPTNTPCVAATPPTNSVSRDFAFVAVGSVVPVGATPFSTGDTNPNIHDFFFPEPGPTNLTVIVTPDPPLNAEWLPACWSVVGDSLVTNVNPTNLIINASTAGVYTVTATAGISTNIARIFVGGANIAGLEFTTDHKLLLDNTNDCSANGNRYLKPEWLPGRTPHPNAPISQTKNTPVTVKLDLVIGPGVVNAPYVLTGTGPAAHLSFSNSGTISSGGKSITMTAPTPLPNMVKANAGGSISWNLALDPSFVPSGWPSTFSTATGPHKIYVTAGTPVDVNGTPTEFRINKVTTVCDGNSNAQSCATNLHAQQIGYDASRPHPNNIWEMVCANPSWQCIDYARLQKVQHTLLGWPGGDVIGVFPRFQTNAIEAAWNEAATNFPNGSQLTTNFLLTIPSPPSTNVVTAYMMFLDTNGIGNNFEGCFKLTADGISRYYAGGSRIFTSPLNCMTSICKKTFWGVEVLYNGTNATLPVGDIEIWPLGP
ncbi:MAG: hypothetical protein HY301_04510 [Verrucomicrobia bacterium]|nr:hypothetical protein [Verrucomicrobiota bacterium]